MPVDSTPGENMPDETDGSAESLPITRVDALDDGTGVVESPAKRSQRDRRGQLRASAPLATRRGSCPP